MLSSEPDVQGYGALPVIVLPRGPRPHLLTRQHKVASQDPQASGLRPRS